MRKELILLISLALSSLFLVIGVGCVQQPTSPPLSNETYAPEINVEDFVSNVTNPYWTLTPGKKFVYEKEIEEGTERIEVIVTNETKTVLGIKAMVVWDRVFLNDDLIEDTKDWYAQDKQGNVWYFGEDSKEIVDGKVVSTHGSWESGVNGAQPGIIMLANPKVGNKYRQEYLLGEAEDEGEIIALDETVSTPYGNFTGCLQTRDFTRLEPGVEAMKFYCKQIGFLALEIEDGERVELINITMETPAQAGKTSSENFTTNITEAQAKEIALNRVPGTVTDIAIEMKFGRVAYVVEIRPVSGPETDVIIDIETGEILRIET